MKIKKVIYKKQKKEFIEELNRKVTVQKFEKYFVKNTSNDYNTKFGVIKKEDLNKEHVVAKCKNQEFSIFTPLTIDQYKNIKRSPQMIPLKDLGNIAAQCGINRDSIILDSGSGSGGSACYFAQIAKKIYTYDTSQDNVDLTKDNIKDLELTNVESNLASIYDDKKIKHKDIDLFILDVPEPWKAIKTAKKTLKVGGFIVNYSPNITSTQRFVVDIDKKKSFIIEKTVEIIEREWEVNEDKVRPKSQQKIIHSGFLTFVRRIN
ncbi:methyltransferase domain-containing protein [Nanoarchaeota archaeon]